ncbi:MAG: hypothetical protein AAFW68_03880 [Pseudomonadota bacterium]
MIFRGLGFCAFALVTACASGAEKPDERGLVRGGQSGLNQPSLLLSKAREVQAEQGCAAALPAYRVISSFGKGYHVAQYELGACLLTIDSATQAEAALLRMESDFWLHRAAWAGNARAQRKLAEILSGAAGYGDADFHTAPQEAAMWALVYAENSARDLYNLPELPSPVTRHLEATLTPQERQWAEQAANNFQTIDMAIFTPPRQQRPARSGGDRGQRPREGRRRPR